MDDLKILVVSKSTLQRIMGDLVTFGCIFAGFFINYHFLGDSETIQVFFGVMAFLVIYIRGNRAIKEMSPTEALKYLSKTYGKKAEEE